MNHKNWLIGCQLWALKLQRYFFIYSISLNKIHRGTGLFYFNLFYSTQEQQPRNAKSTWETFSSYHGNAVQDLIFTSFYTSQAFTSAQLSFQNQVFSMQWFHRGNRLKPCGTKQSFCLTRIYLTTAWQQQTFAAQSEPRVLISRISSGQEPKKKKAAKRGERAASQQRFSTCQSKVTHKWLRVYANCCCCKKISFIINTLWKEVKCSLRFVHVPAKGKTKHSAVKRCQVCFCLHKQGEVMPK